MTSAIVQMKCLEGPELWCHIPYPYAQPRVVTADDFRWLSHDLLFMYKQASEFGANFWNGIYYNFSMSEGGLEGRAQAVDLNHLAAPPDDLDVPPYGEWDREDIDTSKRWLPTLVIR